ncbi:MAG: MMPL family transporter [Spirochaetaceae bacterium]|jgi:predicted RND superfamily exporter protein|nr:MMPL family transporter [Spirochaetaceae bacterium]
MERILFKYPKLLVALIGGITLFFGLQFPNIELDNNNFRFVPETDEARLISSYIDETFGSSTFILVGLERKYGSVFDRDFLIRIREYIDKVRLIGQVGDVHSLITSDYITGDSEVLLAEPLTGADFTGTPAEIQELKRRLLSWDMYRKALISDDFTATQILVPLNIAADNAGRPEVVDSFLQIRDLAREMFKGYAEVYVTGLPVISATINESVKADLSLLVPLVILVVIVIVFLPLKRISFAALSLLPVIVGVIWSVGAMPLFGVKLSVISTVLPVILIAVGNSYGLHVIIHYMEDADLGGMTREQHRDAILRMLGRIRNALVLAALTTTVSFLSFCFTNVMPIREFGYFAGFGVAASFLITFILIPAILLIRGPKYSPIPRFSSLAQTGKKEETGKKEVKETYRKKRSTGKKEENSEEKKEEENSEGKKEKISGVFLPLVKKYKPVLVVAAVIGAVSAYGASKVVIDNIFVEYFKPHTDIYKSERFIREKFGGSKTVSIVFKAETPELLLHPDTLSAIDGLHRYLAERVPEVGKTMSFTDLVKRINQVFNADEAPEGLKPPAARAGSALPDFGFGFGDFAEPESPKPAEPKAEEKAYTPKELAGLLDQAVSAGNGRTQDAESLVWEVKRLINYEGVSYYEIPADPARYAKTAPEELQALVSNYLVLLSGNMGSYANDPLEPTAIRTMVQLRVIGQADTARAVSEMRNFIQANVPEYIETVIGGAALVEASLNALVVQSLWTSIVIALIFLFGIIAVSNRSLAAGLIGVAPLLLLMLLNFAVMGFLGIKLNIGTAMIASLTMGIGIDYTIHYLEAYKREYRFSGGKGDFLARTYNTCGLAIIVDAGATGAGFGVLLFSQFNMLAELGLLIMFAMGMSALAGLIVIPALLMLLKPKFIEA